MSIRGGKRRLPEEAISIPKAIEMLGRVFARSFAIYTVEVLSMAERRGLDLGFGWAHAQRPRGDDDPLESAPEWVRQAYEKAREVAEPVEANEREVRGRLIGTRLSLALKRQDMTQAELARKLGKSPSQISRILRNPERSQLKTLQQIAEALKVDLSDIVRGLAARP